MNGHIVCEGTSKTGTPYIIRYPTLEDTEAVWKYINVLSKERTFVRFQGEEVPLEKEQKVVEKWVKGLEDHSSVTLFLEVAGELHGVTGIDMDEKTEAHVGDIGISVSKELRGQGLGEALLRALMDEAARTIPRLEIYTLSAKEPNDIGMQLYTKLGFKEYGRLPNGSTQEGKRVGLVFMYKEKEGNPS